MSDGLPVALRVVRSNRAERLIDALVAQLSEPLSDPLSTEHVIVQSRGMERWLSMQLSQRLGVAANVAYPFPRHFLERVFDGVLGEQAAQAAPFEREALVWSVAAILRERLDEPAFAPARAYLAGDVGGVLCLQLARRLAQALDDYAVYRPSLLLGWERGQEPLDMQAELLRELVRRHGAFHPAARAERLLTALAQPTPELAGLPARIALFAMASLPPLYVRVLSALARHVPTSLYVLTPSRHFLGDVRKHADGSYEGHPLLAALGKLGRDFQEVLEQEAQYVGDDAELFEDPGQACLLHALQSDMLELVDRGGSEADAPLVMRATDRSIAVHACHSPMREVEVLHDQLCERLQDPTLQPHDIVVMAPDIEAYAPVIEAVFGHAGGERAGGRPFIPYSVAYRGLRPESAALEALLAALDLLSQRVTASGALDLLSREPVAAHLGVFPEELETLRAWLEQAGVHWGIDALDRAAAGQPALIEGTFRFGLERMLLGYAVEGGGSALFAGRLPLDSVSGNSAALAGVFAEVCERLFSFRAAVQANHTLPEWGRLLEELLAMLVGETQAHAVERVSIRRAMGELAGHGQAAGFAEPIALRALLPALEEALEVRAAARGYLARGVTFCQLVPMRSVPFRVVCLLGMSDEAFPSRRAVQGFDRMRERPQVGDRVPRDDDRYVFLEALLCARESLLLTYVGLSAHDGRPRPAAVVVTELLDAIARGFRFEGYQATAPEVATRELLVTEHRLHAFSPRYFQRDDERFFSYAASYCEGARSLRGRLVEPPFIPAPLSRPAFTELRIDELVAWVTRPARTLLAELGVRLNRESVDLRDREPTELDALDRWKLRATITHALLLEPELAPAQLVERIRASGTLPLGASGDLAVGREVETARNLARAVQSYRQGNALAPQAVDLVVDGVRLTGALHGLWPSAQVELSLSKPGRAIEMAHFVRHLVMCALREQHAPELPARSVLVSVADKGEAPRVVELAAVAQPLQRLRELVAFAQRARIGAVRFEHDAARKYVATLAGGDAGAERALKAAGSALTATSRAARLDAERLLYGEDLEILDSAFERLAREVYGPLEDAYRSQGAEAAAHKGRQV